MCVCVVTCLRINPFARQPRRPAEPRGERVCVCVKFLRTAEATTSRTHIFAVPVQSTRLIDLLLHICIFIYIYAFAKRVRMCHWVHVCSLVFACAFLLYMGLFIIIYLCWQTMREGINKFHLSALGILHTYKHTYKTHTHIHSGGRIGGRCSGGQAVVLFDNNRLFLVYIRFIEYCLELIDQLLFIIDHKFVYKLIIFI